MDLREILFAQFPAFFLLSLLFLIAHLRVRKHSAVKSVLWVLLFGAALAVSILFCFLGMQRSTGRSRRPPRGSFRLGALLFDHVLSVLYFAA